MTRTILRRLRAEGGFAVPIALAVMTIALALAAVAVAFAVDSNSFTNRDVNAKAALNAADAGARVAAYRLSQHQPGDNACPDPQPTPAAVGGSGWCPMVGAESVGNGATFEYWVSRNMVLGDACVGPVVDNSQSDISQRCITAIGTANGISERIQERVARYTSTPVFPTAIFGTKNVTISNNETLLTDTSGVPALLGTNGVLTVGGTGGGTTSIDGYSLPPGASVQLGQNVINNGPTTGRLTPYPTPEVTMSTTATNTPLGGTCAAPTPPPIGYIQTNCDYRLAPACVTSCDSLTGTVIFDPIGRTLYLGNNASVVLGGGVYNFCSLYLSNNSAITIAPNVNASIYIDSPSDPGSGCSTSKSAQGVAPGTFSMYQNSTLNPGDSALKAQLYIYGDPINTPPNNAVTLSNNGNVSFGLDAPFSNVNLSPSNNTVYRGAINGYTVTIGNAGSFTYEADTKSLQNPALYAYYRSYWEQCAGPGSTSNFTAGC